MTSKTIENLLPLPLDIESPTITVNNPDDFVFDKVLFDIDALTALQSIFESVDSVDSKSASVKFMITIQDEADLQGLGYSREQIDKFKPQEAADILTAGAEAKPTNDFDIGK
jgi:hypothetical protein